MDVTYTGATSKLTLPQVQDLSRYVAARYPGCGFQIMAVPTPYVPPVDPDPAMPDTDPEAA